MPGCVLDTPPPPQSGWRRGPGPPGLAQHPGGFPSLRALQPGSPSSSPQPWGSRKSSGVTREPNQLTVPAAGLGTDAWKRTRGRGPVVIYDPDPPAESGRSLQREKAFRRLLTWEGSHSGPRLSPSTVETEGVRCSETPERTGHLGGWRGRGDAPPTEGGVLPRCQTDSAGFLL